MMVGQIVTLEPAWPMQLSRPTLNLRRRRRPMAPAPAIETLSRLAVGAGLGAVVGLTTLHVGVWVALGAASAWACGRLRDRVR